MLLTWTASTNAGVTGYKIRQTVDGTTTEIDVTGMSTAMYTVGSLTAGKSYSFTIAAVAGSTESTQSTAVTATPQTISAPQNVRAAVSEDAAGTAGSRQQVVLSWDAVSGAASYKVYQDSTALAATITGATHTVSGLTDGQSYSFTVSAVSSSSTESSQSTAVVTCNFADSEGNFSDADGDGLTEICTLDHLARINTDNTSRNGDYELVRNLDFSSQHSYKPGSDKWTDKSWRPVNTSTPTSASTVVAHGSAVNVGWIPIGDDGLRSFQGTFNGRGYRIENLYMRRGIAGLFGVINSSGVIRNVHVDANLYGTTSDDFIGVIVGSSLGLIIASSSSGTIDGLNGSDKVGGLVGLNNSGMIVASYSRVSVNGGGWE